MTPTQKRNVVLDMIEMPNQCSAFELTNMLCAADVSYHNAGDSFISDGEYDALRSIAHIIAPTHPYFIGVGAVVRGGKVSLPVPMGSLDQVQVGEIVPWVQKNNLTNEEVIIMDKMDGISVLIVYDDDGNQQIAYSRGNGIEGADISRHLFKIHNVPKKVSGRLIVRAEIELTETAFVQFSSNHKRSDGSCYKNSRNAVAGLMNSKDIHPNDAYEYLSVIAYQIIDFDGSKKDQLVELDVNGFQVVPYFSHFTGKDLTDEMLAKHLNMRRSNTDFAIDGLVIDVNNNTMRSNMNQTTDSINPKYSIKYKVSDVDNYAETEVVEVEWNISKHGYLKPRIVLAPITLVGVTVTHTTGYNAKYILEHKIGPGSIVAVSRMGDVIPNIIKVITQTSASMPEQNWHWTTNEVDAVITDQSNIEEISIQQTIDFFTSIDAPHLKEGTIRSMFKQNEYTTATRAIIDMIHLDNNSWKQGVGENGTKIYAGLQLILANIPLYVLMGSSPMFGRGIGKRRFKKAISALNVNCVSEMLDVTIDQICKINGFERKTATKMVSGFGDFMLFFNEICDVITIAVENTVTTGTLSGERIVFTGFRNKELQSNIETAGGTMQSQLSGKTTILVTLDVNSTSTKIQKARNMKIRVIDVDTMQNML